MRRLAPRERALLAVLAWVALAVATSLALLRVSDERAAAASQAESVAAQVAALRAAGDRRAGASDALAAELVGWEQALAAERARFFREEDTDLYAVGVDLRGRLEQLGIEHDNGLTESDDIGKFEKLSVKELKSLVEAVGDRAPKEDIAIYLKLMGSEKVDQAVGA